MKALLRNYLALECSKHIRRYNEYLRLLDEDIERKSKRTGNPISKVISQPPYWSLDPRFNPFKTIKKKKLILYSYTLARKIRAKAYKPERAVKHHVLKEDGTKREVNVFQLPDSAVSLLAYKSLLHRNINRFSAYAYGYREDRSAHDAVYNMFSEWQNFDRIYVAEFDFSRFFDNIKHEYLLDILKRHGFLVTPEESVIIQSFLTSETAEINNYITGPPTVRKRGIPQGTSISLFLANLACFELDRALERLGVGFSRYADDTVIWSEKYDKVVQAYDTLKYFGDLMDVQINLDKSKGINLLISGDKDKGEIKSKLSIEYLGYELSLKSISIRKSSIERIQKKISYIIYQNLLQPLNNGIFNTKRLSSIDWDFVVTVSQVRRYMYGGLTDEKLRKFIRGQLPTLHFRGLMSYYPLVQDDRQLSKLDGWLIYVFKQSLRKRERLWKSKMGLSLPGPSLDWIDNISQVRRWVDSTGSVYDLRIPRFSLVNKAMQVAISKSGISALSRRAKVYY